MFCVARLPRGKGVQSGQTPSCFRLSSRTNLIHRCSKPAAVPSFHGMCVLTSTEKPDWRVHENKHMFTCHEESLWEREGSRKWFDVKNAYTLTSLCNQVFLSITQKTEIIFPLHAKRSSSTFSAVFFLSWLWSGEDAFFSKKFWNLFSGWMNWNASVVCRVGGERGGKM